MHENMKLKRKLKKRVRSERGRDEDGKIKIKNKKDGHCEGRTRNYSTSAGAKLSGVLAFQ